MLRPTGSSTLVPPTLACVQHHSSAVQWHVQDNIVFWHVEKYTERGQKGLICQKGWQRAGSMVRPVLVSETSAIVTDVGSQSTLLGSFFFTVVLMIPGSY